MRWSFVVWGAWLAGVLISFFALEIPGLLRVVPWVTFSETEWDVSKLVPVVGDLVVVVLVGLILHFRFREPLWHSMLFALLVVAAGHLLR